MIDKCLKSGVVRKFIGIPKMSLATDRRRTVTSIRRFRWASVAKILYCSLPRMESDGAGKGNRTLIASLEGWSFTIKLCPRLREKT
jgi:hypothetical protein